MKAKKAFSTTLVDILPQIGTEMRVVGLKRDSFLAILKQRSVQINKRKSKLFSAPLNPRLEFQSGGLVFSRAKAPSVPL